MAQTTEVKFKLGAEDQTAQAFNAILDRLDRVDKSAQQVTTSFSGITRIFAGFSFYAISKQLGSLADEFTNVSARLSNVTLDSANFAKVQQDLFKISQDNRVSFQQTTDLYSQLARATRDLRVPQAELLRLTDGIGKALIVSGASGQSASAALMQLAQGFSAGVLRGQEFTSVQEQTPRVLQAVAQGLGLTTGQLKLLAEEGKLTTQVFIDGFNKGLPGVEAEFKKMPSTIGQAITQVANSTFMLVGTIDKLTGTSPMIASWVKSFSNGIDFLNQKIVDFKPITQATVDMVQAKDELDKLRAMKGIGPEPIRQMYDEKILQAAKKFEEARGRYLKERASQGEDQSPAETARLLTSGKPVKIETEEEKKAREKVAKMIEELQDKTNEILYGKQKVFLDEVRKLGGESAVKAAQEQFDIQNAYQVAKDRAAMKNKDYEAADKAFRDNQLAALEDKRKEEEKNQKAQDKANNYLDEFKANLDAVNDRIALKNDGIFRTNEELLIESSRLDLSAKLYETIRKVKNLDNLTADQKLLKEQELTDEYNIQLERIKEIAKQRKIDQADFMKGVGIGIKKYRDEIADVSNLMEDSVVGALRGIEDAFVKFVETGKLSFKGLANAIISDLIRINVRQNIMTPLSAALGGMFGTTYGQLTTGSGVANQFNPDVNYRAMGGPVTAGQPYIVGEQGPELFMPSSSGTIIPNGQSGSSVVVNQTINVTTGVQQTVRAEVMNMLPQIANAAKSAVAEAKLRGGSFAAAMR